MTPKTRKFPIGMQDYKDLRTSGYLYVDKTALIYKLATEGKQYFLSRPRRFGKSLLLSTIAYYFEGCKDLFEGLAIEKLETEWAQHPVFYIDMNKESYTDFQSLLSGLGTNLRGLESVWGSNPEEDTPTARFEGLIRRAYEQTGKGVVVLFDEYDKPLIETMDKPETNERIRQELKGFYGLMKSMDKYLRFVMYSGVTKFSKISIFSDLNQPKDISQSSVYAEICGITEKEMIDNFESDIRELADATNKSYEETLSELRRRYDGYHFAKNSAGLYNPFSLLNTLDDKEFGTYWYKTGTPTFLVKLIASGEMDISNFEDKVSIEANRIDEFKVGEYSPVPILYQSGYLTIKNYIPEDNIYVLGFPNEEVKYSFLDDLTPTFLPLKNQNPIDFSAYKFAVAIRAGDIDAFMGLLRARFAAIPYDLKGKSERSYQLGFYLIFTLMGQYCQTEVKSAKGRADAVVMTKDAIYVFEFKLQPGSTAEEALAQIDDRGYLIPYTADHRRLVKVGVEFSKKERGISRWLLKNS
ncbi:MAG: ATP-binding protein [Tannerella sp.]|nr:ATP-binding protein [Tannerella sp.]